MALAPPGMSVIHCCELLGLSRSSYYYTHLLTEPQSWRSQKADEAKKAAAELLARIEAICLEFIRYGSPRVTQQLKRDGRIINHKKVADIFHKEGLSRRVKRRYIYTTQSKHSFRRYSNLLLSGNSCKAMNEVWIADITYIRLKEQFIYLAVILDSYSRKVIGWELDNTLESRLSVKALEMALNERKPQPGFIHHSDQGVQYASGEYTSILQAAGAKISMSRRGNPYDNARMESFMKTLKHEEVNLVEGYKDLQQARERIGHFMEAVYNTKRLHSSLGYVPPIEFEQINMPKS